MNGFAKCEIYPTDSTLLLKRLTRRESNEMQRHDAQEASFNISSCVMDMLKTMRNGSPSKGETSKKRSKVLMSPGESMSMTDLKERKKKQKENEKSEKANSTKKATSRTITCENESSEDETDEFDIESMERSLMVRKFDFIMCKIFGKENHFSFEFDRSRIKIKLNKELQN